MPENTRFHDWPRWTRTSWNPGAERLLGYTEKEASEQLVDLIFTPEDRVKDASEQELETARAEGRANDERRHERRDGSRYFAIGAMMSMRDAQGKIVGFLKNFARPDRDAPGTRSSGAKPRRTLGSAAGKSEKRVKILRTRVGPRIAFSRCFPMSCAPR
jgi:two-component system, chemotaxis family, CheB/CheR fusion protein